MEGEKTILSEGKSFQIELNTNRNNKFLIIIHLDNEIKIVANQINDIIKKSFSNKFTFEKIRENKYFLQFDSLKEIFDELKERINSNKITLEEYENSLKINIQLPSSKNKEIIFELNQQNKNDSEKIRDLIQIVIEQNKEISDLKKEVNDLKEKLNILWKEKEERKKIYNLDSKIINGNEKYNECLKNWIDPTRKIKAELLYRLTQNGENISTFHELCDNKGPTLTLFHVNDGNKVGIYTPLSWDSNSEWKMDMDTFIFNLNKNQKYKKLQPEHSIYCFNSFGPLTSNFGCENNSMKSLNHWGNNINNFYDKGSEILQNNNQLKKYDLLETEVYKIIIE